MRARAQLITSASVELDPMRTTDEVEVYRVHGGSAPGRRVRRASARTRRARAPGSSPGEPATGAGSRCARPRARWQWRPGCTPTGTSPRPVRPEEEGRRDCERAAGTRAEGDPRNNGGSAERSTSSTSTYTSLWTLEETKALIAVWGQANVESQLDSVV